MKSSTRPASLLLKRAVALWKTDQAIPADMWMALSADGYDCDQLEAKYSST